MSSISPVLPRTEKSTIAFSPEPGEILTPFIAGLEMLKMGSLPQLLKGDILALNSLGWIQHGPAEAELGSALTEVLKIDGLDDVALRSEPHRFANVIVAL